MVKNSKNLIIFIVILAVISVMVVYFVYNKGGEENVLTAQAAAEKTINFINQNMLPEGVTSSLIETVEENGLYKVKLKLETEDQTAEEHTVYTSKDGKLLFIDFIDMDQAIEAEASDTTPVTTDVPKGEKPDVKLFVMSYCPYGLQAQKMFLPVYELLGDKANMGVYFVNYIMHGEKEINENLIQYCIEKEESQKYFDYLSCFVQYGDSQKCLSDAQIDQSILADCIADTDKEYNIYSQYQDQSTWLSGQYPRFDVQTTLNEQYGVAGSPTVVINGTTVSVSPRSPERFKEVVCQAFNSPPAECEQILSNTAFSTGFGLGEGESVSSGGCGQ